MLISSIQRFSSAAQSCLTLCKASLSITYSQSLLKLMSIELVMPSNHLILCHLLLLPPSIFSSIGILSNESVLHIRWPRYWSFSLSPSSEYSGSISLVIDLFDLLAVQGTLKSLHWKGNGKPLQYSCLENPMNSMKRQKDMTLKDELPGSVGAQYATDKIGEITPEKMKRRSQSKNNVQLWM